MNQNTAKRTVFAAASALALCLLFATFVSGQEPQSPAASAAPPPNPVAAAFEARVREYVDLREGIEDKMEKLPKDATAEQINDHKTAFQAAVRQARSGALPGQLFTREAAAYVRRVIAAEVKGRERAELRKTVAEAETKGVPLRINYPYPESKELLDMPATLLLKLPTLPKQVKYRFVGRNLLLVDRENGLIIDYMTKALP